MIRALDLHLTLHRGGHGLAVLAGFDLEAEPGSRTCIIGDSGVGKSTVLRVLLGLQAVDRGAISIDGRPLQDWLRSDRLALRRKLQPVFQNAAAALPPRRRIGAILREPLHIHGIAAAEHQQRCADALDAVQLPNTLDQRYVHELSGGQQQRLALARALVLQPQWLLADEPTSALDPATSLQITQLLRGISEQRALGLLVVTHDPALPLQLDAQVVRLAGGRLSEPLSGAAWLAHDRAQWQDLRNHPAPPPHPDAQLPANSASFLDRAADPEVP